MTSRQARLLSSERRANHVRAVKVGILVVFASVAVWGLSQPADPPKPELIPVTRVTTGAQP